MRGEEQGSPPAQPLNRGMLTATVISACVLQGIDTTIANVALPHIQGSMSASQDQISWVLTSYIVSSAIMMPLTGWLAGRFGVRHIFLASVIGFTIASALCGAATSLTAACALPHAARHLRRRAGAAGAGDAVHHLPARAARPGDGDLQHRRDDGSDHRPDIGRLADRQSRLALVLLYQPAGRRDVRAWHPRVPAPIRHGAARAVRCVRLCDADDRGRLAAIDARPR